MCIKKKSTHKTDVKSEIEWTREPVELKFELRVKYSHMRDLNVKSPKNIHKCEN